MTDLDQLKADWEYLAQTDPLWAICSDPTKARGAWQPAEFFASGEAEIGTVLAHVESLGLRPDYSGRALDFGCGVGRLTRALAARFAACAGVDISDTMIAAANDWNRAGDRCVYLVNDRDDLRRFEDGSFSFIYSSIVLQHMEPPFMAHYITEFVRLLTPDGILVFQVPDTLKHRDRIADLRVRLADLRVRLALRTRLRRLLGRGARVEARTEPPGRMEMHCLKERRVRRIVQSAGGAVVDVRLTNSTELDFNGRLRYLAREPETGFVSKQYCVMRRT
jgi:SAM-dependent methyltransferase